MLFDTHAHLDDEQLYPDIDGMLARAKEAGVGLINTIGCDWRSSLMAVRIAEKYPDQVYAAIGVHPHEAKLVTPEMLEQLVELARAEKVIAWGEIGLDYCRDHSPRDVQRRVFHEQLTAAKSCGLPVVIHDRDAHQDILEILTPEVSALSAVIMHCFSGTWEIAKKFLRLGCFLSFAGPITFHNARIPVEVANKAPLDKLLIETDCPYLAPQPYRGKTNEPCRLIYTAERLAQIRGVEYERIAEITTGNAKRAFNIQ